MGRGQLTRLGSLTFLQPAFLMDKNTAVLMRKCSRLETYADTTHCETMHHKDEASFSFHVHISPKWLAFNTVKFSRNMANIVTWTPKSPCVCLTALTFKCSLWWCLARTWSYGNHQTIVSMHPMSATRLCICALHGEDKQGYGQYAKSPHACPAREHSPVCKCPSWQSPARTWPVWQSEC